jgi:glycosyltransferase involved in cell wall biosynthesis
LKRIGCTRHKISVVLSVYNDVPVVDIVLRLLNRQNYQYPWELVICDDGSRDDMAALVKKRITNRKIKALYIWQQDEGFRVAQSRNNGLRNTTGDVVVLLDGDMAVAEDFLALHAAAHKGQRRLVCGGRRWTRLEEVISADPVTTILDLMNKPDVLSELYTELPDQLRYLNTGWPWMACIGCNMSLWRNADIYFDERFLGWGFEDDDFAFRLYRDLGYKVACEPGILGLHLEKRDVRKTAVRPTTAKEIGLLVANLVYFEGKHGRRSVYPALRCIGAYCLDTVEDKWRLATRGCFDEAHIEAQLNLAKAWAARQAL